MAGRLYLVRVMGYGLRRPKVGVRDRDVSIHPLVVGRGKLFFWEGETASLRHVATKSFSKGLVKLTYEPQYYR